MKKAIAALAVTAGLAGGALIGAPIISSAATGGQAPPAAASAHGHDHEGWIKETLDGLVKKGTITQAQADAVLAALRDARNDRLGLQVLFDHHAIDISAQAIGMPPKELREQLRSGKSIAQVAEARGVDVGKVRDALVDAAKKELAQMVASGRITQAEADKRMDTLPALITTFLNAVRPAHPAHP